MSIILGRKSSWEKYQNIRRYYSFIENIIKDSIPPKDVDILKSVKPVEVGAGDTTNRAKQAVADTPSKGGKKPDGGNKSPPKSGGGSENGNKGGGEKQAPGGDKGKKKDEGKFVELPGAEMGKVVVRFPPEASG